MAELGDQSDAAHRSVTEKATRHGNRVDRARTRQSHGIDPVGDFDEVIEATSGPSDGKDAVLGKSQPDGGPGKTRHPKLLLEA